MFDFLLKNTILKNSQRAINKLDPAVNVHLHDDMPLPSVREVKKLCAAVVKINSLEQDLAAFSDAQLKAKTDEYRQHYEKHAGRLRDECEELRKKLYLAHDPDEKQDIDNKLTKAEDEFKKKKKEILDEILPEAFAVVREAGKRVLNMRHFDVQLIGGMVLHEGNIAEMTTGEGKTLVATLPAYLNAITGEGVHIVTVNDYLARRDMEWMGPLFRFLGLTIGVIQNDMGPSERQQAYGCDITYGTNNEFGFDYLRDNMVIRKEEMVQRKHHFAIVDEVDSILIDEARTPLIISGPAEQSTDKYYKANDISRTLKGRRITERDQIEAKYQEIDLGEGYDYLADEKSKTISLTEEGEEKAAKGFGIDNLHDMDTIEYRHHILQALKAKEFFKKDVEYVVRDGQVIIVDEFTGRLMPGRRWSDGLHQAVEAKEGIKIERENQTLATITFQNYFRLYDKLSGMTGTAYTEANEFSQIYKLDVAVIPTNKPLRRDNMPDSVYKSLKGKFQAIVNEIEECHKRGQPVLVGTISIEKSEILSRMLKERGVEHQVLNAKFHEMEAQIVAQAGRFKAVTIATNMAGRGTDIVLGGNPEFLAQSLAQQKSSGDNPEEEEELTKKFIGQFQEQCKKEHDQVIEQGGLYVMGTERHESRRIDNQLRGRQGRQGDPGKSKFFVSLEDDLMRLFGPERIIGMMDKFGMEEDQPLEHPLLSRALETAQKRVEGHNFEIRKHLIEFDDVMNKQREVIYNLRQWVLESESVKDLVLQAIEETISLVVAQHIVTEGDHFSYDFEGLGAYLKGKFNYDISGKISEFQDRAREEITEAVIKDLLAAYEGKENEIDPSDLRHIERMLFMNVIDSKWKDHLYAMDQLKEGIGLRSYGQRNPLMEYKKEGFEMFQMMYDSINQEVAEIIFKVQPAEKRAAPMRSVFGGLPQKMIHDEISSLSGQPQKQGGQPAQRPAPGPGGQPAQQAKQPPKPQPVKNEGPKVGRNDPCPCGSGKKYKKCCGR